jgi:hypothetical protein
MWPHETDFKIEQVRNLTSVIEYPDLIISGSNARTVRLLGDMM